MSRPGFLLVTLALLTLPPAAGAAQCSAESGPRRVALLELYTSEGCDSCPPTDRWVSGIAARGLDTARIVTLGFHVDYWNYLGWRDPFASAEFSARQRTGANRAKARVVYTPQLVLNGTDYRRGFMRDDLADRVGTINQDRPGAQIRLKLAAEPAGMLVVQGTAMVTEAAQINSARVYLALYENRLSNAITAGENRGKQLHHDYVVRALAGPFVVDARGEAAFVHRFKLEPGWKSADLHVASFVQDESSGDVLQALALPACR